MRLVVADDAALLRAWLAGGGTRRGTETQIDRPVRHVPGVDAGHSELDPRLAGQVTQRQSRRDRDSPGQAGEDANRQRA